MLYWRGSGRVRFLRGSFDGLRVFPCCFTPTRTSTLQSPTSYRNRLAGNPCGGFRGKENHGLGDIRAFGPSRQILGFIAATFDAVSTSPGATAFTRIPKSLPSSASVLRGHHDYSRLMGADEAHAPRDAKGNQRSRIRRFIASSQTSSRSSSKISFSSSAAVSQALRLSSPSSWPDPQPA